MSILISVLSILITILFVIGTHEFGHFITARLLNVKVLRFSIGFGKTLCKFYDKKGTEYVIALIPLGGYVKMLGETEPSIEEKDLKYAFNRQPFYKKFLILSAGPFTNILCAFLLYWLVYVVGFSIMKPVIGQVSPGSIAAKSGLQANQEIIGVDQRSLRSWMDVSINIIAHVGNQDHLILETKSLANQKKKTYILDLSNWRLDNLEPDPLRSLGIIPYEPFIPPVIGIIPPHSPAALSPLQVGDYILLINHQPVKSWNDVVTIIRKNPDTLLAFTIKRQNKTMKILAQTSHKRDFLLQKSGFLNMGPQFVFPEDLLNKIKYSPLRAISPAFDEIVKFTYFNFILFGKLLTGKMSVQSLGGPITIFEGASNALSLGFLSFIGFLAFLSMSVGIINILPIPGLDGGNLFIYLVEFIIRRPLPEKALFILYQSGLIIIFFLLFQALLNDVLRIF